MERQAGETLQQTASMTQRATLARDEMPDMGQPDDGGGLYYPSPQGRNQSLYLLIWKAVATQLERRQGLGERSPPP
jgi:hypothetical protein